MTKVSERFREVRTTLGLSQRQISKKIHISQSLYCDMENGHLEPKERYITLISSQFNINLDWLRTGHGDMFGAPPPDVRLDNLTEMFKQLNSKLQDVVLDHLKGLLKVQEDRDNHLISHMSDIDPAVRENHY